MQSNVKYKIYKAMKNIKVNFAILMAVFFINCAPLVAQQTSVNRVMETDNNTPDAINFTSASFDNKVGFILADNTLPSLQKSGVHTTKYYSDYYGISIQNDQIRSDIPSGKAEVKKHGADNRNNIIVTSVNEKGIEKVNTKCQSDENEPMNWRRTYLWSR